MTKLSKIIIVGGGSRGTLFAKYFAEHPGKARVVGVAEPRDYHRQNIVAQHKIPAENVFYSWEEILARPKFADAVVITTQDKMHTDSAIAFANMGYHILLEKPMATTFADCEKIVQAVVDSHVILAVCHCLRYTADTQKVKEIIDSGKIGDIVNIQRLEPVGYWHQAHSFVRGEWANSVKSSPMLLAKSCHDIDWIAYVMNRECLAVSSFGDLAFFKRANKPAGSSSRCINCPVENECPYSAQRLYMQKLSAKDYTWPLDVVISEFTEESLNNALRYGPYGKCVFDCDNDVVDNQVVNMLFEGGRTASLTMTAFCAHEGRKTNIFGTKGHLTIDEKEIRHFDFRSDKVDTIVIDSEHSMLGGHGGGDYALAAAFVEAVTCNDQSKVLSGPYETLNSHKIVFCAEKARLTDSVVRIKNAFVDENQIAFPSKIKELI